MLRDSLIHTNENEGENEHDGTCFHGDDWREIDRALQRIGKQRAALDAEEARWLVRAARVQIWRKLGFVSLLDYLERRCDYAPRTARDRIRVAFELEDLPGLTAALATGELGFTSIKELVRVVTPEHEDEWLEKTRGKTCFEIQKLVSGRKKGSRPSDAPDPDLATRPLRFEDILPTTVALSREARAKAQHEHGERVSDDALLAMAFGAYLQGTAMTEGSGRAKYQIAVTVCEKCNQGWQDGAGSKYAMAPAELARAECDAQRIGSLDAKWPARAKQDIPPSVRRLVWRRDSGKCAIPSCRSAAHCEFHHIVAREHGGTHDAENICLLCDSCHAALHRRQITITGTAPSKLVITRIPDAVARAGQASKLDRATTLVEARTALVTLGYKKHEAAAAVDDALIHVGPDAALEVLLREALRRCLKPTGYTQTPNFTAPSRQPTR
jgi:hypothetical protein